MIESSNDLWQELSALADSFGDLARVLHRASRPLQNPGELPPISLDTELVDLRQRFASLNARSGRLAAELDLATPDDEGQANLKSLAGLLERISEAEQRRDERNARIARAFAVLDRVLSLEHTQEPAFSALLACREQAAALRQTLAEASDALLVPLAAMDHPFAYLLTMVEGAATVSDDVWEQHFEVIGQTFGRALAAAVARGKIVERAAPVAIEPQDQSGPAPAPEPESEPASPSTQTLAWSDRGPAICWPSARNADLIDAAIEPDELIHGVVAEAFAINPWSFASLSRTRRLGRATRRRILPRVERLEKVSLMAANIISGYVYLDANDNGLFEPGETPVAAEMISLENPAGTVIATTTTNSNGAYSFSTDQTVSTAPLVETRTITVPLTPTNFTQDLSLPQFDPSLGNLFQVDLTVNGSLTSDLKAENTSVVSPATITSTIAGQLSLTGPAGINLSAPLSSQGTSFDASAYDGNTDYAGTSGTDFGSQSASVSKTLSLSTAQGVDLSAYLGTGTLPASFAAQADSTASGGGNLMVETQSNATATITVTYHYTLNNALQPGDHKIVQVTEPPGTLNGLDSANGTVLPFNPGPGSNTIPVTVPVSTTGTIEPNNDFGALLSATISGYVYADSNENGLFNPGEPTFPDVPVVLTGKNDLNQTVDQTLDTDANGAFDFINLRPGTYSLSEPTAPVGYSNGLATSGNQTPIPGSDQAPQITGITLTSGAVSPNNDFGKIKIATPGGSLGGGGGTPIVTAAATPTPTPTPTPARTITASKTPAAPQVTTIDRLGIHHQATSIVVLFNSALDPASASGLENYHLAYLFRDGKVGPSIPIRSAVYDPSNNSVTLTPEPAHLNIHYHYQLSISGVTNTSGVLLDGTGTGKPGGTFVAVLTKANDPYPIPTAPKPHALEISRWARTHPRLAAEWTSRNTPGLPPT